ncbi:MULTISPECIES: helix-turn-helix transcriptional regulator [Lactobacillus]|uniref:XRE family transcriptional regulator n=1 Tax=Lactobacillus xujianguonis TaxID=2495899 RepID=A0A437SSC7_9LACO|nr:MULTISPECIES: helix-turn-helix transcriptional regulator [Lactobacillus]RVU69835.1 XRE family transcriptional regulator [Lactobacillus xujianguonis]RVU77444.1 XRE family transcriptional regulator [Lactobacillus xujianguonis]
MAVVRSDAREILSKYLDEHGIKQSFVAKRMGISSATFSSRLHGRLNFDADFAIAVAKALRIDPDIFLK